MHRLGQQEVYCPQNFLSRNPCELVGKQGAPFIRVEWNRRTCERYPVRALCTTATWAGRSLTLKPRAHHEALIQAREQETAQHWKQLYALRQGIEATLSQGVRRFDLRQARYWGEAKMRLGALSTAAALNLTRWSAWVKDIPRGPPLLPYRGRAGCPFRARLDSRAHRGLSARPAVGGPRDADAPAFEPPARTAGLALKHKNPLAALLLGGAV